MNSNRDQFLHGQFFVLLRQKDDNNNAHTYKTWHIKMSLSFRLHKYNHHKCKYAQCFMNGSVSRDRHRFWRSATDKNEYNEELTDKQREKKKRVAFRISQIDTVFFSFRCSRQCTYVGTWKKKKQKKNASVKLNLAGKSENDDKSDCCFDVIRFFFSAKWKWKSEWH